MPKEERSINKPGEKYSKAGSKENETSLGQRQIKDDDMDSLILGEVLKRVDDGDSIAANAIYQRFAQRLIAIAATNISKAFNAKLDPEDIVQSVFRSFFVRQSEDKLEFEKWHDLWSFLAHVTVMKCCENVRKLLADKRNLNREQSLNNLAPEGMSFEGVSIEPTAHHVMTLNETLENLLEVLRPIQRDMLKMKLDGHTNAEIAKAVGRTERSIYRLSNDIKARAHEILGGDEETSLAENDGEGKADHPEQDSNQDECTS